MVCITANSLLTAIIQSRRLTLFRYIMRMDDNADAKRILLASTPADWRRQPGRSRITWLSTVQQDLNQHHLIRSPKQQIWLRTALCGTWCRRMALRNLRAACHKWRQVQVQFDSTTNDRHHFNGRPIISQTSNVVFLKTAQKQWMLKLRRIWLLYRSILIITQVIIISHSVSQHQMKNCTYSVEKSISVMTIAVLLWLLLLKVKIKVWTLVIILY